MPVLRHPPPAERRVAHTTPHIIRFFTLFRRHRCKTPDEYQHEHESNCNVDELFHYFLLMTWILRDIINRHSTFLRFSCLPKIPSKIH
jgi:hypothetical protein